MTIFTPNTVIRSTEINANFDELDRQVGALDVLEITFNNGTGTRSTLTSAGGTATLAGATGDTSYTAPADQDVTILFTMTQMVNPAGGTARFFMSIDGTALGRGTYHDAATGSYNWSVQTVQYKVDVDAGDTITIGAKWTMSAGTATVTNANTDSSYPNAILGIVTPR